MSLWLRHRLQTDAAQRGLDAEPAVRLPGYERWRGAGRAGELRPQRPAVRNYLRRRNDSERLRYLLCGLWSRVHAATTRYDLPRCALSLDGERDLYVR